MACALPRRRESWILACSRRALKNKQVDLIAGNMTDGLIPALDLSFSKTTATTFLRMKPCRSFVRRRLHDIRRYSEALDALAGKISDDDMRRLNYAVDGEHRDVKEVVREFRRGKGL